MIYSQNQVSELKPRRKYVTSAVLAILWYHLWKLLKPFWSVHAKTFQSSVSFIGFSVFYSGLDINMWYFIHSHGTTTKSNKVHFQCTEAHWVRFSVRRCTCGVWADKYSKTHSFYWLPFLVWNFASSSYNNTWKMEAKERGSWEEFGFLSRVQANRYVCTQLWWSSTQALLAAAVLCQ